VSATVVALPEGEQVLSGPPAGTVDFYDGGQLLGSAALVPGEAPDRATASIATDLWVSSGARAVTAVFIPAAGSGVAGSTSPAQTYRIVDTERIVPDIALTGEPRLDIVDSSLTWTIGNIWFANFNVGFEREVVSGNVSLPDMDIGTTIPERQAYYWRPFTFSGGSGQSDAEGNRVIGYEGTARLTSGNGHQWNFSDPAVHISPSGDGYITAEFSGFYDIGGVQLYGPVRVTIATFTGAEIEVDAHGAATARIDLNWEGQARGPGTWAHEHNASFPNEFVALLNPGISLFFAESSVSTDSSKIPHPITLSFREGAAPAATLESEAVEAEVGGAAVLRAAVTGSPAPAVQWQSRTGAGAEWQDLPGETAEELTLGDLTLLDAGREFRVAVSNDFGSAHSAPAVLAVREAPVTPPVGDPVAPVLTDGNQGGFQVISIDGRDVTVNLGEGMGNQWVGVTVHSDPQFLGWFLTAANGDLTVTVPAGFTGDHRLSFVDSSGALLGWVAVSFPVGGGTGGGAGDGGTTTGGTVGGTGSGQLSTTGSSQAPLVVGGIALVLLVAGGALLVARKRARSAAE
jgi:hypothetical protein